MSYGVNAPQGLVPVRYVSGAPYEGAVNSYQIASGYATSLFFGDPIINLADGTIGIGTAGATCLGVFRGCKYTDTSGNYQFKPMWTASTTVLTGTTVEALIADDPNLMFSMQEAATNTGIGTGTPGTALALADRGLNINFKAPTSGVTATGQSAYFLDNAAVDTSSTKNFRLIALDPRVGNVVGDYANWLVGWNTHAFKSVGVTGV